jgi:iron complex transport system substrate-binding protein
MTIRAVSFLPAATQIVYDLGLQDQLHGVTFECPSQARRDKPILVTCSIDTHQQSSQDIDRIFSAAKAGGESLYFTDDALLQSIAPDVVLTQDVCEVCQIDAKCTQASMSLLERQPEIVILSPCSLQDVFETVSLVATALGAPVAAEKLIAQLQVRIDTVVDTLRRHRAPLRRIALLEWFDPLYNCGHWIPDQIALAGGADLLSHPGGDSIRLDWQKLRRYDPEVLVIAPCGFSPQRSLLELDKLTSRPGFADLRAARDGQVYVLDFEMFTQPSPSTLVRGIEVLASIMHPGVFGEVALGEHAIRLA